MRRLLLFSSLIIFSSVSYSALVDCGQAIRNVSEETIIFPQGMEISESLLPTELRRLEQRGRTSSLSEGTRTAWNWIHSTFHNLRGVFAVVDIMALRKLPHGLIDESHPWATGQSPHTQRPIWPDNIAFASPRSPQLKESIEDVKIVSTVGKFLSSMVKKSATEVEIEQGPKRRMPHAVNYIHGTVHYNGVFMIFNHFKDAMFYFTDPKFVKEFKRLAKVEKREITLIFREREYKESDLAFFMGFIRGQIPWYANGNGPKKKVFYGGMSSYVSINTINGSWINDMYNLKKGNWSELIRPPIQNGQYFNSIYSGSRTHFNFADKVFAHLNYLLVKARGIQGGLVFSKRNVIEPLRVEEHLKSGLPLDNGVDWKLPTFRDELSNSFDSEKH